MQTKQSAASIAPSPATVTDVPLSEELVQRVTDQVYRLLLRDLKLERERRGGSGLLPRSPGRSPGQGGR